MANAGLCLAFGMAPGIGFDARPALSIKISIGFALETLILSLFQTRNRVAFIYEIGKTSH
jgi:hypothetical protein